MDVVRFDDPAEFLAFAGAGLRRDEARNQLALAVSANAAAGRAGFVPFEGWAVVDGAAVAATAVRTPPRNVVLGDPGNDDGLTPLTAAIASDAPDTPGVTGNVPAVDAFAERWSRTTGDRVSTTLRQGVFALDRVVQLKRPPGAAEPARAEDIELLVRWWLAFEAEALPHETQREDALEQTRTGLEERLHGGDTGVWLWRAAGQPVSMTGFAGPTGAGIRIGPVYTPPEHRRRGYAGALVADVSAFLLANGYARCFLYTDLANPTANRIYEAIGYRRVAESKMLAFER
jgi:RimJ/RimL family protein N-acetyltransferase